MSDRFEFIGFDCCLMGTAEVANILATYSRYFYGSQEIEPGSGWYYTTILNYLAGKEVDFINKCAMEGTILAHVDGGVPNIRIDMDEIDELALGELFYKFEFGCGVSGYTLGVNPFNQPGVESYKKNMFALLGKPGFEEQREALLKRL